MLGKKSELLRAEMIKTIEEEYGFNSPKVFSSILQIKRENFISKEYVNEAYKDKALPIGFGQTISQPYTVAFMTHLLTLREDDVVLEIGTGSGYQAAVLSKLVKKVYSVEIIKELAKKAKKSLAKSTIENVVVKTGSGESGLQKYAPYDAILVTAGAKDVPIELINQLKTGGRLVIPVGKKDTMQMLRITKKKNGIKIEEFGKFSFVPFVTGKIQKY